MSVASGPIVIKKKLSFKGANGANKVEKARPVPVKEEISAKDGEELKRAAPVDSVVESDKYLTESEKRFKKRKLEQMKQDAAKMANVSYRQRVEDFNAKLAQLTEHNDIPRISAAGNG